MASVFTTSALLRQGLSAGDIRRAVLSGRIRRVRRGWYATPDAADGLVRAARIGGALGCVSAAREHGIWVPTDRILHVAIRPGLSPVKVPAGVSIHRLPRGAVVPVVLLPVLDCLRQVLRHHDAETALIVLESAVDVHAVTEAEARSLIREAPPTRAKRLQHFTPGAQSGSETRVRLFLQRRQVQVRAQVRISTVGIVDLVVGESLIIECDSRAHHDTLDGYRNDRRRDLAARQLGFTVVRLTWEQVMLDWPATQAALGRLLATREHRRRPRTELLGGSADSRSPRADAQCRAS